VVSRREEIVGKNVEGVDTLGETLARREKKTYLTASVVCSRREGEATVIISAEYRIVSYRDVSNCYLLESATYKPMLSPWYTSHRKHNARHWKYY
jgi:hypothetical protein